MQDGPIILETAGRHGMNDEDILHALRHEHHHFVGNDGMVMIVGADQSGTLIEVGLIERHGELVVAHAMCPAHPRFLTR